MALQTRILTWNIQTIINIQIIVSSCTDDFVSRHHKEAEDRRLLPAIIFTVDLIYFKKPILKVWAASKESMVIAIPLPEVRSAQLLTFRNVIK